MLANKQSILSTEEINDLTRILYTKYASFLDGRSFTISVSGDSSVVELVVLLCNVDESFYYPVHGRIATKEQNMTSKEGALFLLDYIDCYFDEYFKEAGDLYLPIDWSKHTFEDVEFQIKGQIANLKVERMADSFLRNDIEVT